MPPLPAQRCSPGIQYSAENSRLGDQFGGGLIHITKDDELALFNEVYKQETDNFLLHTADDFEDSLSKLSNFSDFNLGINTQTIGETSDLLNGNGDKNDYDWLLTPPDTPLFRKLDDDDSQPSTHAPSGGKKSQPIPFSRSVSVKSYQTSRAVYSPQRSSLSSRSCVTSAQARGNSYSAMHSSPPPAIRSTTPIRSSCSPIKSSTSILRSATPTLQRKSTSFSFHSSNIGANGSSSLPKMQGWEKTLPDFNSEALPKLKTSLSEPTISYDKASSPASRDACELSTKIGRKSMSPMSSRSISASYRSGKDHISLYCNGFVESFGDVDEESLPSMTMRDSRNPPQRKDTALENKKDMPLIRKPSSMPVTRRYSDSALRLDQRQTGQTKFRPLLTSVPATTFIPNYSGNSSVTTSSNTSTEQNCLPGGWDTTENFDTDEVFLYNKVNVLNKYTREDRLSEKHQAFDKEFTEVFRNTFNLKDIHTAIVSIGDATSIHTPESTHYADNQLSIDGYASMIVCPKCGVEFSNDKTIQNQNLCQLCTEERFCMEKIAFTHASLTENVQSRVDTTGDTGSQGGQLKGGEPEIHEDNIRKVKLGRHQRDTEWAADLFLNNFLMPLNQNKSQFSDHQHLDMKRSIDVSEGADISVLLDPGSISTRWPILQETTLSATNILCSEPSCLRNNSSVPRRSIGVDSTAATSSIDLGLPKQSETYAQPLLSDIKESLCIKNDIDSNLQSTGSDNDISTNSYKRRNLGNGIDEICSNSTECFECDSSRNMAMVSEKVIECMDHSTLNSTLDHSTLNSTLDHSTLNSILSSRPALSEDCRSVHIDDCRIENTSESPSLNHTSNNNLPYSLSEEIICAEECSSSINNERSIEKTSDFSVYSEMVEDYIMVNHTIKNVNLSTATDGPSIVTFKSQLEDKKNESMLPHDPPSSGYSIEHSISQASENEASLCSSELTATVLENGNSTVLVGAPREHLTRSLTLNEATNTMLFCSSIVHDIAYKAATIAMENDQEVLTEHRAPIPITIPEKSFPVRREESGKMAKKHTMPRVPMSKMKIIETRSERLFKEAESVIDTTAEKVAPSNEELSENVSEKPMKIESKCSCVVL